MTRLLPTDGTGEVVHGRHAIIPPISQPAFEEDAPGALDDPSTRVEDAPPPKSHRVRAEKPLRAQEGAGLPAGQVRRTGLRFHPALIVVLGVCAVLVRPVLRSGLSGDVFYEMAAGKWMLAHHAVARYDVFSYTVNGHHWLDEEWGFQVLLAWLVAHVGPVSYWLVSAGACVLAVLFSVARWRRLGAGWLWTGALAILAGAGLYVFVTPRPQDLSYLLFAAVLLVISLARQRHLWLVAIPPLLLVWANLHGSFLLGLGLLVLELVCAVLPLPAGRIQASKSLPLTPLALTLVASVAATMVNPNGPGLLRYALHVSSSPQLTSLIAEWQSPDFHSVYLLGVIIGPVIFFAALLAFSDVVFAFEDVVLACVMLLATLHAGRFMPYLALAMCSVLARWAPIKTETIKPSLLSLPVAAVACAALVVGPHTPAGAVERGHGSMGTPVAATNFLEHQAGRVFATYWWDDYLVYRGVPVFVDGRTDMYFGTGMLTDYVNVADLTVGPDTVFRRWDVRWVMWDKGTSLAVYLWHDPAWHLAYRAGDALVFEHVGSWRSS